MYIYINISQLPQLEISRLGRLLLTSYNSTPNIQFHDFVFKCGLFFNNFNYGISKP